MWLTVHYIHLFLKIHPIGKGQSLQSNHWSFSNRLWLFPQFSVKLFMKHIFFSFVFIIFAGCASPEKVTETPPATAEVVPATEGKIDYDAINKSILKDVSKKIVDKASKKD